MLNIKWEREGAQGSYRDLEDIEGVDIKFIAVPDDMTTPQKLAGIFAKFNVKMPYAKEFQMTIGVEQTTDERYGGFKFRSIGVSSGMNAIANPLDFETTGKIFNALHNTIIDRDGNVKNIALYNKALEFADISKENLATFKANGRAMRKSLADIRKGVVAVTPAVTPVTETPATTAQTNVAEEMTSAVE